jgi:hypothetical protein
MAEALICHYTAALHNKHVAALKPVVVLGRLLAPKAKAERVAVSTHLALRKYMRGIFGGKIGYPTHLRILSTKVRWSSVDLKPVAISIKVPALNNNLGLR